MFPTLYPRRGLRKQPENAPRGLRPCLPNFVLCCRPALMFAVDKPQEGDASNRGYAVEFRTFAFHPFGFLFHPAPIPFRAVIKGLVPLLAVVESGIESLKDPPIFELQWTPQ